MPSGKEPIENIREVPKIAYDSMLVFITVKVDLFTGSRWIGDSTGASYWCAWKHCYPAPYQTDQEEKTLDVGSISF